MPRKQPNLVYSRIVFPNPLPAAQVEAFFTRLAASPDPRPIVLEVRADELGITHLLGCQAEQVHVLRRLLADLMPDTLLIGLGDYHRGPAYTVKKLKVTPAGLPLDVEDPMLLIRAFYSALARKLKQDEFIALQLALGSSRSPQIANGTVADPRPMSLWQALTSGPREASNETRSRVRDQLARFQISCTLRIGISAPSEGRRRRLGTDLLAALRVAQSPGVRMELAPENPASFSTEPVPRWWSSWFSPAELTALCGWPIGAESLPGMPPAHPRPLRAEQSVESKTRVFARSLAPGDDRLLGLTRESNLLHGFIAGPNGSGKTNVLLRLAEQDIADGAPLLILDPKAQMPDHLLARIKPERWKDVVIIDATDPDSVGFNPLDAEGRDPDVVADALLAVFMKVFADSTLGPRMQDVFSASFRTLTRSAVPGRPNTLLDLIPLWTDANVRRRHVEAVKDDLALMSFWHWFEGLKDAQRDAVLAPPMNRLRQVLLRPAARHLLGQRNPGFRLRDVWRERKVVLVPLNEGLIGPVTANLIGALVVSEVWQATQERATEPDHQQHPGVVLIDEADRFVHLPVGLDDALARSRSLSVAWILAMQYLRQAPVELRSALETNARSWVVFKQESYDEARTIAKLAPGLTERDFMELGRFQIYTKLVAGGVTTKWALAETLPPTAPFSDPDEVRRVSQEHHRAPDEAPEPETGFPTWSSVEAGQTPEDDVPALPDGTNVGRSRRTTP